MADSARRRRAIRAAQRVENDALRLENETLRTVIADLETARRAMVDLIIASPSDWQVTHAKGLVTALDAQLAAWQARAVVQLGAAYTTAADLGVRQTVDPLTAAGVDLLTRPVIPATIVATAYQTLPDLIGDVRSDTVAKVGSLLRQSVLGGLTPTDAMRLVGRIVGPAARGPFRNAALRSEFIVRTELGRILQQASYASQADLARYDANAGMMSEWVTAGDSRVRHDHAAAGGQRVPVGGEFHIGGYPAKYPHDPRLPAKESIGCRCRILPWHPSWGDDVGTQVRRDIDARLGRTTPPAPRAAAKATAPSPGLASVIAPGAPTPVRAAFDGAIGRVRATPLAMRNRQYVAVLDKIERALDTIGRTFRDGNLPPIPAIGPLINPRPGLQGQYRHELLGLRMPISLEFRATATAETVFHEITHFIDQHGLGINGQFASTLGFARRRGALDGLVGAIESQITQLRLIGPTAAGTQNAAEIARLEAVVVGMRARAELVAPVADAIAESAGYKALGEALATGKFAYPRVSTSGIDWATGSVSTKTHKWIVYAMDPREVFSRAMAQYLSQRSGPAAVAEIESALYAKSGTSFVVDATGARVVAPLADQWTWEDFAPIDAAITDMFDRLGWLVK